MSFIATLPESTYLSLVAEFGEDRVEHNLDPERYVSEGDFPVADRDFPVWTASDAEAWDEWLNMTEEASREAQAGMFN